MSIEATIAAITGVTLNQTVVINSIPEPCHFITFDSDLVNKKIPRNGGIPAARLFFPSLLSNISLAYVTGNLPPEIIQVNATGATVNGVPAWSIAVARWTNVYTPSVGQEVIFVGNTNTVPTQAQVITGCTGATINSAIVDYNNYTNAVQYDFWYNSRASITNYNSLDLSRKSTERSNFIKFFDDSKVTTGLDLINIAADATQLIEVANDLSQTSITNWPALNSINVSGISEGIIYATYTAPSTKSYTAQALGLAAPSNGYRVAKFTNIAGTVTVQKKKWLNAIDADEHHFRDLIIFRGAVQAYNSLTLNGAITALGAVSGFLPAFYHDTRIEYTSANQITIKANSRFRSADNTRDIVFNSDYVVDMSNATPTFSQGGRSVAELANTFYHLYVGLDSSLRPIAWLDTANLAGGGSVTNPAAYFTGRRQVRFSLLNNASSNIEPFAYSSFGSEVLYESEKSIVSLSTATNGTANCSSCVPPTARKILANVSLTGTNTTGGSCRVGQSAGKIAMTAGAVSLSGGVWSWNPMEIYSSTSQGIYWEWATSVHSLSLGVYGYKITEVQ